MNISPILQTPREVLRLPIEGCEQMSIKSSPESLADYVRRVRTSKGFSLMDVEKQSARTGEKIAESYVSRIENGRNRNPSPDKIKALARGLGVHEAEVTAVAFGKSLSEPTAVEERLLVKFRELPAVNQNDLIQILDVLHREHSVKPADMRTQKKSGSRAA